MSSPQSATPSDWLASAAADIGQTPATLPAFLTQCGIQNIIGSVEDVKAACRAALFQPLHRPVVLGWPTDLPAPEGVAVFTESRDHTVLRDVLRINADFIAIVA